MSGDSNSPQLLNSDTSNLDSSDDVIEIDSDDSECDHNDSLVSVEVGTDVSISESLGNKTEPGLNLLADKPDANCITSTSCILSVSELGLISECTFNAEGTLGIGSATELTTNKESTAEPGLKDDSPAFTMKSDECVHNLESQGHDPVGLDSGKNKFTQEYLVSNNCLAVEECFESRDVSIAQGEEGHVSAKEMTASNWSSSGNNDSNENLETNKDSKENSETNKDSKENSKSNKDSNENLETNKDKNEKMERNKGNKKNSETNKDGKENSERNRDCKENSETNKDSKENSERNKDSKENSRKNKDSKENSESNKDHKENSERNKDIKENSGKNNDRIEKSEKNKDNKDTSGKIKDSNENSGKNKEKENSEGNKNKKGSENNKDSKDNSVKNKDSKENSGKNRDSKENSERHKDNKKSSENNKDSKENLEKNRDSKVNSGKNKDNNENSEKNKGSKESSEKNKDNKKSSENNKDNKESSEKNKDTKENLEKKQHCGSEDTKRKSLDNKEKKDESRRNDKRDSKKRSQSHDRKGSGTKSGRGNRSPGKKDGNSSRTKRNRSGSRHREDEVRKRRRVSKSRSRSRHRDRQSRTQNAFDPEREKARKVSDILQGQIDRLKEEVENARAELRRGSRRSRSRSLDRGERMLRDRRNNARQFDELGDDPLHYRSRSRSLEQLETSDSISRRTPLPSVQRFLDGSFADNSEEKLVVVVQKVDVTESSVRYRLLTKFKRYGELCDSSFDTANKAAILHYKRHECAHEAVKSMDKRYFLGEYLKVMLVNEHDAELAMATNCSLSGRDRSISRSRSRERRARSSSLGLHWPAQPRHPSTNLFDTTRDLSPLSLLMATESMRDGGNRPVLFRPRPLPAALTKTSTDLSLGPERLARREMLLKKMNSIVKCDWGERSLSDFEVLATVGKGTYGQMYKAVDKDMKLLMALKKVAVESDKSGVPVSALQEMKLLSRLDHPNIVKLVEVLREDQENFVGTKKKGNFYFLYDYMNHDLKRLLQSKLLQLKSEDVAWFIKQLLSALSYCHRFGLVHRDVRPSNILINNRGELKLAQFGLACLYDEKAEPPTSSSLASAEQRMVTLWYRAPELLLGAKKSSPATDIWSCGCVIGEIFSRKPVFLGSDEQHQIEVISKVCGTPSTSNWPDVTALPLHYILKNVEDYPRLFHDAFHYVPYMARNLLDQLLVMDPAKRLTSESALDTDWLKDADFPKMLPMMLVNINDCHMLMPAKSSIDSDIHCLPGVGKTLTVSLEDRKMEGFTGNNFGNKTRAREEDVSDKVAIARSLGSTSAHKSDTVWKPLKSSAGRETIGLSVADVQVSRESVEKSYPMSSQLNRRPFNPRVMDYACQPTYANPASVPEKPVQQPEKTYVGSLSVRPVNVGGHTNLSAESNFGSSLDSRSAALPSGTKPTAQASDDRTYAADLERLRMLKKRLAMVGTEKRDPHASLAKTGDGDNWDVPPAARGNLGESAEFGVDRFKRSSDPWANEPFPKKAAIPGQPPMEETTSLRSEREPSISRGNMDDGYRRQKQPVKGPQSSLSQSSAFGGSWEDPYTTRDEGNPLPFRQPSTANAVERPTMAPGRAPVSYGDPTHNRLHSSYTGTSEYDNSTPYNDLSVFAGGRGAYQPMGARPPYNRKPLPSQMNPGIRGPASTAQARGQPFSYPENTAEQQWAYDREMAGHTYPGRSSESTPYVDERWRADDRWNDAARPHPGPESDVEWRAPESRF